MTSKEKKMIMKSVQLSDYELNTLKAAKITLKHLFGRLTAKDNITHVANMFNDIEGLIEELEENGNQIIEFDNMEE